MAERWRLKKGDEVVVLTGKDKGKTGSITKVLRDERRVYVQGINMIKRHTRPQGGHAGGIIEREASMHASNVAILDPATKQATRVSVKVLEDGRKVRIAKRSGEILDA